MRRPTGGALGIITNAGGPGVMAVDAISSWNLEPANLSSETLTQLNNVLPSYWSRSNPIDLMGDATANDYLKTLEICLTAWRPTVSLVILAAQALTDPIGIAKAIAPLTARAGQAGPGSLDGWRETWPRG